MIDRYDWAGGREAMIRFGPAGAPFAIVALPPFEEANRTRTFAVTIMRALADRGIASVLPDLPGANDSLIATEDATLEAWRAAFAAAAASMGAVSSVAIRSGALIDSDATVDGRWHLAPQTGTMLIRELDRLRGDGDTIAGNSVSHGLLDELGAATVSDRRTRVVRLESDTHAADRKVAGAPLWHRAEPDNDVTLAEVLADDIADWVRTCGG